mmetsp:Transcript_40078/g.55690  ORF Transcript_40078/g.55690 Transcript_40078/m.55690 type:complete len:159 (-) Transcript_40078:175-651(-)|eukprot:CAMPEP_0196580054 /NCGR_PEP_ID=MMETSP1081-20130531/26641_1 /TAXON_ID=36882 /ORGANISM="Pyramimonas amylifera, Strain CCMP720" /LENGTH=158 /DNA_ID=CAMNT_0041899819 /DNA_START=187 /DNA_END=663 /DNA_ORIENTATION=-
MPEDSNFVPPPENTPQSFLIKLVNFLGEEDFEDSLTRFLRENASKVELRSQGEEQTLETYTIYQAFLTLVEGKLEGFASREGLNAAQLQAALLQAKKADESANTFLDALIASWDFDVFIELVQSFLQEEMNTSENGEGNGEEEEETAGIDNDAEELFM